MNPQETATLKNFLDQLVAVGKVAKDPEADAMINRAVQQQPDAPYLLVQRALLLGQALDQAKARIAELERAQEGQSRGFLDPSASSWNAAVTQASAGAGAPGRAPAAASSPSAQAPGPPPSAPVYAAPAASWGSPPSGAGSSFLGQAAAAAAGAAGGAFLFEGLENMFGHHGGGGVSSTLPTEDVTINNYYADDARSEKVADRPFERDDVEQQDTDDIETQDSDDFEPTDDNSDFV